MTARRALPRAADEALRGAAFVPGAPGELRRGGCTASAEGSWLVLRERESETARVERLATRVPGTTPIFADPFFASPTRWRTGTSGERRFEVPLAVVAAAEVEEVLELLDWVLDAEGCAAAGTLPAAELLGPDDVGFQLGSIVRQGALVAESDVARLGFPLLTAALREMSPVRAGHVGELLGDATRRTRWVRLGLDASGCPAMEVVLPAAPLRLVERVARLARDVARAFLAWILPPLEFVASGGAACVEIGLGTNGDRALPRP